MDFKIKVGNNWSSSINSFYIKVSNSWQSIKSGWIKVGSIWQQFFGSAPSIAQQVEISQSTDGSYVTTLTGKNYYWTNFGSGQYYFQKSINGGSTWSDIDNGVIANPSSGSYNTKTYIITSLTPNVANLYRFLVSVSSIGGGNSTSSTSSSTTVQSPRDITNLSSTGQTTTSIDLSWGNAGGYALSYIVYYRQTGAGPGYTAYTTTSSTSITVSSLTAATEYAFYVVPYTGTSGQGYSGNDSNILYQSTSTPPLPGDFVWDTFSASGNTISASWSSSNATSYYVEIYKASNGSPVSGYPKTNTSSTSDTIYNLEYSTQYKGFGYGKNAYGSGNSTFSNTITTDPDPTPGSFTYSISNSTITPTQPSAYSNVFSSDGTQISYDWNDTADTSYWVSSISGGSQGTRSNSVFASNDFWSTTPGSTYTTSVYSVNTNRRATVSWGASTNANSYVVVFSGATQSSPQTVSGTSLTLTASGSSGSTVTVSSVTAFQYGNGTGLSRAGTVSGSSSVTIYDSNSGTRSVGPSTAPSPGVAPSVPRNITGNWTSTSPNYVVNWSWDRPSQGTGTITYYYRVYSAFTQTGTRSFRYSGNTNNTYLTTSFSSSFGTWAEIDIYAQNAYGTSSTVTSPRV